MRPNLTPFESNYFLFSQLIESICKYIRLNESINSISVSQYERDKQQTACLPWFCSFSFANFPFCFFLFHFVVFFCDTNQMQIDLFLGFSSLLILNYTKNSYTMNRLINEKVLIVLSCGRNVKWMCHHFYSFSQRHRACFILHHGAVDFVLIFMSILVAVRSAHKILKL